MREVWNFSQYMVLATRTGIGGPNLHYKDQNFTVQNENEIAKFLQIEPFSNDNLLALVYKITSCSSSFLPPCFSDEEGKLHCSEPPTSNASSANTS